MNEPIIKSVALERVNFYARQVMSRPEFTELMDVNIDAAFQYIGESLAFTIRGCLLGEDASEEICEYPADWFEAFKERWFPRWAIARWPVKRTKFIVKIKAVFPDYKPSLPPSLSKVRFATMTQRINPYLTEDE